MLRPSVKRIDRRTKSACHRLNGPAKAKTERRQKTEKKEYINYNNSVGVPISLSSFVRSFLLLPACFACQLMPGNRTLHRSGCHSIRVPPRCCYYCCSYSSCDFASSFGCTLLPPSSFLFAFFVLLLWLLLMLLSCAGDT